VNGSAPPPIGARVRDEYWERHRIAREQTELLLSMVRDAHPAEAIRIQRHVTNRAISKWLEMH
jgi:hypothetical protein